MTDIRIGIIGADTSHVAAFTQLLHDSHHSYHVPGGKVVAAFPGGSPDFPASCNRVGKFTKRLRDDFGVRIVDTPEEVAASCDALLLESVDGRVHLQQFRAIAPYGKPVFIDKPFTVSAAEAAELIRVAERDHVPIMSSSALRYAEGLTEQLADADKGAVIGAETYGPMEIIPQQPGYFWYGIHAVEMLFAILGPGCRRVTAISNELHDVIVGQWEDNRIGTVRGNRAGNNTFGAVIHREKGSGSVDIDANPKPYYASLLERVMLFFREGRSVLPISETFELIRFLEAANLSRMTGSPVELGDVSSLTQGAKL